MSLKFDWLDRLVVLFKEDKQLHDALVKYILRLEEAQHELVRWRRRRTQLMEMRLRNGN